MSREYEDYDIGSDDDSTIREYMEKHKNDPFHAKPDLVSKKDLKDYSTKTPLGSMQWKAIGSDQGLAGVFKFAQKKYGNVDSWRNRDGDSVKRYIDAQLRHQMKRLNGEDIDVESGLPHLAHELWCIASLLEFYIDDTEK